MVLLLETFVDGNGCRHLANEWRWHAASHQALLVETSANCFAEALFPAPSISDALVQRNAPGSSPRGAGNGG